MFPDAQLPTGRLPGDREFVDDQGGGKKQEQQSSCNEPSLTPVTVARHQGEKCERNDPEERVEEESDDLGKDEHEKKI
jgi:hypothetical protein